jgi:Na+/melibiose symporter-like transporter
MPALPPAIGLATLALGIAAGLIYMRHAWRRMSPILDPRLFSNNVPFSIAILGGSIFRIGNGAVPFLLPLMFQLGFGMTPFESGMLTFASALGALAMKFLAPFTLRTGGFRRVLVASTLLASLFIALNGLFTPDTPSGVIVAVLLGAGFLRSLFFTSTNALVFAEIDDRAASQATAILAFSQQISIAVGVAVAGVILEGFSYFSGEALGLNAFSTAFVIVAAITSLSALPFSRLAADAGSTVSGHRRKGAGEEPPAAV